MAGKRLKTAKAQVDRLRLYQPLEAFRLLKSFEGAKFDEAVEVHFRLGLNVRHADEQLRGTIALPNGLGKDVKIITLGRKALAALRRPLGDRIIASYEAGNNPQLAVAQEIGQKLADLFEAGEADVVTLFYSRFKSVISQTPTAKRLIPAEVAEGAKPVDLHGAAYEYEPDAETILEALLPRNITTQIFSAMLENQAGFFAVQMSAMDNATRNAGDMINAMTITYNRTRQAQITKELIEIISGAEAI